MVHGRFQDRSPFDVGLKNLTVFADYRVPQTLHNMGILKYNNELWHKIIGRELIPVGSMPEMEIRAATIVATDALTAELNEFHSGTLNVLHTDYLLWSAMRARNDLPEGLVINETDHHHTMTTYY
jgi:hypothetical protein